MNLDELLTERTPPKRSDKTSLSAMKTFRKKKKTEHTKRAVFMVVSHYHNTDADDYPANISTDIECGFSSLSKAQKFYDSKNPEPCGIAERGVDGYGHKFHKRYEIIPIILK